MIIIEYSWDIAIIEYYYRRHLLEDTKREGAYAAAHRHLLPSLHSLLPSLHSNLLVSLAFGACSMQQLTAALQRESARARGGKVYLLLGQYIVSRQFFFLYLLLGQ